ncbi:hypothetical protein Hanom_Chr05g00439501 [Helianthus anomalus]
MLTEKSNQILILDEMATKLKPQGPRFKRFKFSTKVAKVTKPQGPFLQFTLNTHNISALHTLTLILGLHMFMTLNSTLLGIQA